MRSLLIKNTELNNTQVDVLCHAGTIVEIQPMGIGSYQVDHVIDAQGGALVPGLHDHHIHLAALTAQRRSVNCGPPEIETPQQLGEVLASVPGSDWIRGTGYHESVAGDLTAKQVDRWESKRPVRIQHRSGRLWYFNTLGAKEMGLAGEAQGQLYRKDEAVSNRLGKSDDFASDLKEISKRLAAFGVTAVTDATPSNDDEQADWLRLNCPHQDVFVMGGPSLSTGHLKLILDDYDLPSLDEFSHRITQAHNANRPVAIHCVSKVEVVFTLAALSQAGVLDGDRLEHATELPADTIDQVAVLELTVVPNPNFILQRGDQYLQDNSAEVIDSLYPIKSLTQRGLNQKGGTDAPFGDCDPWEAIEAAVKRRTRAGCFIGKGEGVSPEQALELFTNNRKVAVGESADLVVLQKPWLQARSQLSNNLVKATVRGGAVTYSCRATT